MGRVVAIPTVAPHHAWLDRVFSLARDPLPKIRLAALHAVGSVRSTRRDVHARLCHGLELESKENHELELPALRSLSRRVVAFPDGTPPSSLRFFAGFLDGKHCSEAAVRALDALAACY